MSQPNNTNTGPIELSYYRLLLLSYLKDSHPDKATDTKFIVERGDSAAESYSQAIKEGLNHVQASEIANDVLFKGLHFSPFDTIVEILTSEFSNEIPAHYARGVTKKLLPLCAPVIESDKYQLNDEFADSPEYRAFYTELVGFINSL